MWRWTRAGSVADGLAQLDGADRGGLSAEGISGQRPRETEWKACSAGGGGGEGYLCKGPGAADCTRLGRAFLPRAEFTSWP